MRACDSSRRTLRSAGPSSSYSPTARSGSASSRVCEITHVFARWGDVGHLALGLAMALPIWLVPLAWPGAADRGLPFTSRHIVRFNFFIFVWSFLQVWFGSDLFFDFLGMEYHFPVHWTAHRTPVFLYFITIAYFSTYYTVMQIVWRAFRTRFPGSARARAPRRPRRARLRHRLHRDLGHGDADDARLLPLSRQDLHARLRLALLRHHLRGHGAARLSPRRNTRSPMEQEPSASLFWDACAANTVVLIFYAVYAALITRPQVRRSPHAAWPDHAPRHHLRPGDRLFLRLDPLHADHHQRGRRRRSLDLRQRHALDRAPDRDARRAAPARRRHGPLRQSRTRHRSRGRRRRAPRASTRPSSATSPSPRPTPASRRCGATCTTPSASSTRPSKRALDDITARRPVGLRVTDAINVAAEAIRREVDFNADRARELAQDIERDHARARDIAIVLDILSTLLTALVGYLALRALAHYYRVVAERNRLIARRAEELEMFAGRVAHDILGPLSATRLAVSHVAAQVQDPNLKRTLERGQRGVDRVATIVDGLLRFARAGARPEPGVVTSVAPIVQSVVAELEPLAQEAGVDADAGAGAAAAPSTATPACSRASSRTSRATPSSTWASARSAASTVRVEPRPGMVRIEIEDSGPGIPPALYETIFDPHVRGPSDGGKPGIGLGLATVKRIAESHGGRVGFHSKLDSGTTFWVELPRADYDDDSRENRASAQAGK